MEGLPALPKKLALSPKFRAARRYYFTNEDSSPMLISTRTLEYSSAAPSSQLGNPLVLAAIVAGVIGVTIIAVIIIGVWIRTRLIKSQSRQVSRRRAEGGQRDSTYLSSMSTIDEFGNETQVDTIDMDETKEFDGGLESVIIQKDAEDLPEIQPSQAITISLTEPEIVSTSSSTPTIPNTTSTEL